MSFGDIFGITGQNAEIQNICKIVLSKKNSYKEREEN